MKKQNSNHTINTNALLTAIQKEANLTRTENGAVTYRSTGSACLDLFGTIGALRSAPYDDILTRFVHAWAEDKDLAMKILFYGRDIRGGLGERRMFRIILTWLAVVHPEAITHNLKNIPEYGRFDDMMMLLQSPCKQQVLQFIEEQLKQDLQHLDAFEAKFGEPLELTRTVETKGSESQKMLAYATSEKSGISLLAKWMPSINASSPWTIHYAKLIADHMQMRPCQYRKMLTRLRASLNLLENYMRVANYTFDYSKQPSKAMFIHRNAFLKNDMERYYAFLDAVANGTAKLNTAAVYPYEIIKPIINERGYYDPDPNAFTKAEQKALDVTWNAQKDYTQGKNALVVIDGSGSMYGGGDPLPAEVALSLGIYFAERNTGAFKDHFITFSETPQLVKIKGDNIVDKVCDAMSYNECANTNIEAVFDLILNAAIKNKVPQAELPETIYIISDMEFDCCADNADLTNFENAKLKFQRAGYELPHLVFWNVQSRHEQQPVTMNDRGVTLVSGCSPSTFELVVNGTTPYEFMMKVLNSERYAGICA